jgi:predicted SAM-dependent methyltransferase
MLLKTMLGFVSRPATRGTREARRALARELVLSRRHFASVRTARQFAGATGLKLHLACGPNIKPGWLNIDLFARRADLRLDLREPFPFADSSVAVIYSEHFFEHLAYPGEVGHMLRESLRVLQPGGLFSVGVPDTEPLLEAYATGDEATFRRYQERWHPSWCDTHVHQVNYHFRQGTQHKYAYDFETLARILETAGFEQITRRTFDPSLDSEARREGTLYVDARKPLASAQRPRRLNESRDPAAQPAVIPRRILSSQGA